MRGVQCYELFRGIALENHAFLSCKGVVKILKNIKLHKAAGPDDFPLMLL